MKKLALILTTILCLTLLCPVGTTAVEPEDIVVVVEPTLEFVDVSPFREGLARVRKGGKWGFIDTSGNIAIPLEYDYAGWFGEGLAYVEKGGDRGFIDTSGNVVVIFKNAMVCLDPLNKGLAKANGEDGKYGFIDANGNIAVPLIYDFTWDFSEGLVAVEKDEKWGFVDSKGNVVIPLNYDGASSFSEGLAAVKKDEKWGFIDSSGNTVIPFDYGGAGEFKKGLAPVEKGSWNNRQCGFIDKNGSVVIPLEYIFACEFSEGLAAVNKDEKVGFINTNGDIVIPFDYDDISLMYAKEIAGFSEGLAAVKKDGKWGFIDDRGKITVPIIYDTIFQFNHGYAVVRKDGKWGILHNTAYGKAADITFQNPFTDVQAGAWYFDGIAYVYEHNLMNGTAADKFSPESTLTRAMLVTILYRQAGEPDVAGITNPFSDVAAGTWYSKAVVWAAAHDIVTGYGNGIFGPNDAITHEQLAAILYRWQQASQQIPPDILMDREYPDFSTISDYAKSAVNTLTIQGLYRDIPGTNFNPKNAASRAEVAVMLHRYLSAVK